MWRKGEVDRHTSEGKIVYKMASWYWQLAPNVKSDCTQAQFVRWQLMEVCIGGELTHIPPTARSDSTMRPRVAG